MSRHRLVRNLQYDDYADEWDEDEEEEEEEEDEEAAVYLMRETCSTVGGPAVTAVRGSRPQGQQRRMTAAIARCRELIGDRDEEEIRVAIEQAGGDLDRAADLLLDAGTCSHPQMMISPQTPSSSIAAERPSSSATADLDLFGEVNVVGLSLHESVAAAPSALATSLADQRDRKDAPVVIPPPRSNRRADGITPFTFEDPSPDTRAREAQLRTSHDVPRPGTTTTAHRKAVASPTRSPSSSSLGRSGSTPSSPISSSVGRAHPQDKALKGMGEGALRRRRQRIALIKQDQELNPTANINLVVVGHVDAGKSTLMGHLLYLSGSVSSRDMHKYEKESREQGKASFKFAWVLDTGDDERSHGVTVDIASRQLSTPHRIVTLLDAPGHRDFVPNMITGAAQADCALLVVDGIKGEFERGFNDKGQTKEHAVLLRSMGISEVVVVVNKLDMEDWSEERFNEVVQSISAFLKGVGFHHDRARYIPCSGLQGINLVSEGPPLPPALSSWYNGPNLLDMIDTFSLPHRQVEAPLRASCSDVSKQQALGGLAVQATVLQGCLLDHDKVLLLPANQVVTVKSMLQDGISPTNTALPGQRVDVGIQGVSDESVVTIGSIMCDIEHPLQMVSTINATIITLEAMSRPLLPGSQAIMHAQSQEEPCTLTRFRSLLHKTTGDVVKKHPRLLTGAQRADVIIHTARPIGLEPSSRSPQLSRFTLRRDGRSVAVGVVRSTKP